jgi:hypothetical protein
MRRQSITSILVAFILVSLCRVPVMQPGVVAEPLAPSAIGQVWANEGGGQGLAERATRRE